MGDAESGGTLEWERWMSVDDGIGGVGGAWRAEEVCRVSEAL